MSLIVRLGLPQKEEKVMKIKQNIILALFLCVFLVSPTQAKMKKLAQTGYQFLKIGLSARAEAMGGAFTLVGNDANSVFYNPAGLSHMQSTVEVNFNSVQWIADINYNAFSAAYNMGNIGVFAVHFAAVDYGDIIGTRVAESEQGYVETGDVDVGAYYGGIAYSRQLTNKFFVGGQVKYVAEKLGSNLISPAGTAEQISDNKTSGLAFDFGTIYYTGIQSVRVGINIRNFSREIEYQKYGFQMPLTFQIGLAMDMLDLLSEEHANHSFVMALDAIHPRDYTERINVGAEYWFMGMIALRGGYKFNHDTENLTAGVGFKKDFAGKNIILDYCFTNTDYFDSVNRISLGISF